MMKEWCTIIYSVLFFLLKFLGILIPSLYPNLTIMKALQVTSAAVKSEVVVYTKQQMLQWAGTKLAQFWLSQDNLLSVSYLASNEAESKNAVLWIILKGIIKEWKKTSSLLINFYDNWKISYLKSTGNKDNRMFEKISKDIFETLVNSLSEVSSKYDTY